MSISNPSAGVNKTAPPAALILSIISSKKCAEPVTSRFFVLIVPVLVMLSDLIVGNVAVPLQLIFVSAIKSLQLISVSNLYFYLFLK